MNTCHSIAKRQHSFKRCSPSLYPSPRASKLGVWCGALGKRVITSVKHTAQGETRLSTLEAVVNDESRRSDTVRKGLPPAHARSQAPIGKYTSAVWATSMAVQTPFYARVTCYLGRTQGPVTDYTRALKRSRERTWCYVSLGARGDCWWSVTARHRVCTFIRSSWSLYKCEMSMYRWMFTCLCTPDQS